jgi:hypothetical protein
MMGAMSISMFLGISWLAHQTGVVFTEESERTVVAQVAHAVFGGGPMFYVLQAMTAGILILAANTAYQDFPRLSSILAQDRFMPRQFMQKGDRLVFSNGIIVLAALGALLIAAFDGNLNRLIQLYLVGVFISFTLSQTGMVRYWMRNKGPRWKQRAAINGFGGLVTGVVFLVVVTTKFLGGAWMVVAAIPVLILLMLGVNRHYAWLSEELEAVSGVRSGIAKGKPLAEANTVIVLASPIEGATIKALAFARTFNPRELRVLTFGLREKHLRQTRLQWKKLNIRIPVEATGHRMADLIEYVRGFQPSQSDPVTVIIPDVQDAGHRFRQLLRGRRTLRIKGKLLFEPGVVVASVPFRADLDPEADRLRALQSLSVIVLVSGAHGAARRAVDYAESLRPTSLKALMIAIEPEESSRILEHWDEPVPLEIVDSPFRSILDPLFREIEDLKPTPKDGVAVVIPEFIVPHWWQQLLHLQTALLIKGALLFRPNVIVMSVPYVIRPRRLPAERPPESPKRTPADRFLSSR